MTFPFSSAANRKIKKQTMKKKLFALLLSIASLSALANEASAEPDIQFAGGALKVIPSLDVARYMGTWFEIAKYPNWFQKKCSNGGTSAEYTLMSNGQVQVINRCRLASGEMNEAIGVARQLGPATSAQLEVRFAPSWLSFLPFVWGKYWVIDLDDDYQLVAVSEPNKEYLWILSRTPKADSARYSALLHRLRQQGFNLEKLELTPQD